MKLIIIRGVPGTGKTTVAKNIKEELSNSEIICVDDFKVKMMKKNKSFDSSQYLAYEQALKKLYSLNKKNKDYIILEELICEKDFLNNLHTFLRDTKSYVYWFRLKRKLKYLLEIELNRKRAIKNSLEDFNRLKKSLDFLKIKREHCIKNDDLNVTVKKILEIIR